MFRMKTSSVDAHKQTFSLHIKDEAFHLELWWLRRVRFQVIIDNRAKLFQLSRSEVVDKYLKVLGEVDVENYWLVWEKTSFLSLLIMLIFILFQATKKMNLLADFDDDDVDMDKDSDDESETSDFDDDLDPDKIEVPG